MVQPDSDLLSDQLDRLRGGDDQVLADLFSHYQDRLKRIIHFRLDRRLKGRVSESDVVQETYIDAVKRVEHYRKKPEMPFFVWLRLLLNQHLAVLHRRHLEAEKRDVRKEVSLEHQGISPNTSLAIATFLAEHATSPSHAVSRAEQIALLENAIDQMKPVDREIIALRHFEELTNTETAEVLGIKQVTASTRYVRAIRRLREIMTAIPGFEAS